MKEIDDEDIKDFLATGGVQCLDFWAEWCGPCKLVAPIFERVAEEFGGRVQFAKIDADRAQQAMEAFGVRGVPTILVLRDRAVVGRKTGAVSAAQLRALLATVIEPAARTEGVSHE